MNKMTYMSPGNNFYVNILENKIRRTYLVTRIIEMIQDTPMNKKQRTALQGELRDFRVDLTMGDLIKKLYNRREVEAKELAALLDDFFGEGKPFGIFSKETNIDFDSTMIIVDIGVWNDKTVAIAKFIYSLLFAGERTNMYLKCPNVFGDSSCYIQPTE